MCDSLRYKHLFINIYNISIPLPAIHNKANVLGGTPLGKGLSPQPPFPKPYTCLHRTSGEFFGRGLGNPFFSKKGFPKYLILFLSFLNFILISGRMLIIDIYAVMLIVITAKAGIHNMPPKVSLWTGTILV